MNFVNLYPLNHPLHFYNANMCCARMRNYYIHNDNIHNFICEIPKPTLPLPQVVSVTESGKYDINGISLEQTTIYGIKNLPEYKKDTVYIVGDYIAKVAKMFYGRNDCLVPYGPVIDSYNLTQVGFIGLSFLGLREIEDLDSLKDEQNTYCTEGYSLGKEIDGRFLNIRAIKEKGADFHFNVSIIKPSTSHLVKTKDGAYKTVYTKEVREDITNNKIEEREVIIEEDEEDDGDVEE